MMGKEGKCLKRVREEINKGQKIHYTQFEKKFCEF